MINSVGLDRLLNQLNISPIAAKDKQLHQVISQLIRTLKTISDETNIIGNSVSNVVNNISNGKSNGLTIPLHSINELDKYEYNDNPYPSLNTGIIKTIINNNTITMMNTIENSEKEYVDSPYPSLDGNKPIPVPTNVVIINDDTTAADMRLVWVTANSGNLPLKVSFPGLIYRPSNATISTGNIFLTGNAIVTLDVSVGTGVSAQNRLEIKDTSATRYACRIFQDNATDSFGLMIDAGIDSGDYAVRVRSRALTDLFCVRGDGNVGIGITNPGSKFVTSNAGAAGIEFDPASGSIFAYNRSTLAYAPLSFTGSTFTFGISGSSALFIDASKNIAMEPVKKLFFDGVAATGDTYIIETSANVLDLFAGANKTLSLSATVAIFNTPVRLKNYTVATLPAGTQGDFAFVTDALAPAYHVTVVGGGAVVVPVFFNGATWIVN